jgi:hypothetical protein
MSIVLDSYSIHGHVLYGYSHQYIYNICRYIYKNMQLFIKISTVDGARDAGNGLSTTGMPVMPYPTSHIPVKA